MSFNIIFPKIFINKGLILNDIKVGICCFGPNNQASVKNIINKVGGNCSLCFNSEEAFGYKALILPGVGSYDFAMKILYDKGWVDRLNSHISSGGFLLGICLGMQLLCEGSEEGNLNGLGLIPGEFVRFKEKYSNDLLKIPHMGWNNVSYLEKLPFSFSNNLDSKKYYFIHSYHYTFKNNDFIYGQTKYGKDFGSVIGTNNGQIMGVQFHPEKSHIYGMEFFKSYINFIDKC